MWAIVTKIPLPYYTEILNIWNSITDKFGYSGVKMMPIPHFTWHLADKYNFKEVEHILRETCAETKPFIIETSGLAFFKNEMFVAYNGIQKSGTLKNLHKSICKKISTHCVNPLSYYLPNEWSPHITLVFQDKGAIGEPEKLLKYLKGLDLKWKFAVDNFHVIKHDNQTGTKVKLKIKFS